MAPWVTGVKTGHTFGALYVLVGSGKRKGVELISDAIGAPSDEDRFDDNLELLEYGFRQYRRRTPIQAGEDLADAFDPLLRRRAAAARRPRASRSAIRRGQQVDVDGQGPGGGRRARSSAATALGTRHGPRRRDAAPGRVLLRAGRAIPKASMLDRARGLRRRPPDPYRGGGVRDTHERGIALQLAVPPKDEGNRVTAK